MNLTHNRRIGRLCAVVASTALYVAASWAASPDPEDSASAKAKLAAVRARIVLLTNRLGDELKQRDALSARLRAAELVITAKRRRLDELRAAQVAAERRRSELRALEARDQNALQAERAALAAQVRAAYMIGRQEQLKLLLNQSNPAGLGRTLAYYGYFADARSNTIEAISAHAMHLQQLVEEIDQETAQLKTLENDVAHEVAALERARAERSDALAAVTRQVASGNQELGHLKREEQAVESLVADLARMMQDFPTDATQSFERMRGKLPWPVLGKVTAHYQELHAKAAPGMRWNGEMIEAARRLFRPRGVCRLAAGPRIIAHHRTQRRLHDPVRPRRGALQIGRRLGRSGGCDRFLERRQRRGAATVF
jgi:septal ring factor EnvC (AmiA/AmiB activator)